MHLLKMQIDRHSTVLHPVQCRFSYTASLYSNRPEERTEYSYGLLIVINAGAGASQ